MSGSPSQSNRGRFGQYLLRPTELDDGDRQPCCSIAVVCDLRPVRRRLPGTTAGLQFHRAEPCHYAGAAIIPFLGGQILASDHNPDHNVQEGERFIAMVYNAIRTNPVWRPLRSWSSMTPRPSSLRTFDHVPLPAPRTVISPRRPTRALALLAFDRWRRRARSVRAGFYIPRHHRGWTGVNGTAHEHAWHSRTVTQRSSARMLAATALRAAPDFPTCCLTTRSTWMIDRCRLRRLRPDHRLDELVLTSAVR